MNHIKSLSKLLERYENSEEDFYFQMKRYYESGIVTSVKLPFSKSEVKANPSAAVKYFLEYKAYSYDAPKNLNETMNLLFELGPVLFAGDKVEVLILDEKVVTDMPSSKLLMDKSSLEQGYTIRVKLLHSGSIRQQIEANLPRDLLAEHLKERLKSSIYLSLRTLLFDGFSDNPQADLKMANEVTQAMGVVITEAKDVEQILTAPYSTDLGLRDLAQIYVLHDLLQDESWWVHYDADNLAEELKEIIYKTRQARIDSPICEE
jgi:hypothetical protein